MSETATIRFTINAAAKMVGVSRSTLMRWEERGLTRKAPVSRKTGHRSYSSVDIEYLKRFKEQRDKELHPLLADPDRMIIEDDD